ncbi:MAG: hypothetical protein SWJ54_25555, partial [Cyanobacteriota bacterium]|nr:hypothetical protein [Cyanobacteriota bacterium]
LRSFYLSRCTLSCNRLSSISTTIDTSFFAFQGLYHNSQIPQEIKLDNALLSALNSDFSDIVSIIKESDESKDHLLKIIIHEFSVSLYSSLNYYTYNESLKCLLQEILQQIQNHFENITKIKKWWMDKGFNLVQELRAWTIENRGIGHCFDFSEEQEQLLKDYSEANLIFVQCLNSLPNVSPEVREEIEETLLLPIDEIEKWKQQHRPNT